MEQIKKGIFIDFDGVISKSSVRITIDFLHSFFNKREPISYNFVENYVKVVSCFPVEDSVKLLFKSLGMERYLKSFYKEFKALDSDSSRIIIEQTFYEFLDFCDKHSIEYRILSLASKNRLELIKGINPKRILGLEYSKANSKTYASILKSFSKNKIEWFQLDDSPLALRSGKRAGLKTIMMLNDVFTIKDYQLNKEFIDFKTVSFNHIKKLIS